MKVRLNVTLDVDPQVWAAEYGIAATSRAVRDDVLAHFRNTVHEHYVTDLSVVREATVAVPSSYRPSRLRQ